MRRSAYRIAAFAVLLTVIVGAISADAQRKRRRVAKRPQPAKAAKVEAQPTPTAAPTPAEQRPAITAAKVREDVVNRRVAGVSVAGLNRTTEWRFLPSEWKEIEVVGFSHDDDSATVTAHIRTGDDNSEMEGRARLRYEWYNGGWTLNKIENDSLIIRVRRPAQTPAKEAQPARGAFKIVSTSFALPAGYLQQYSVFIPPNAGPGHVFGNFRATSGDNVQVHVLDSDGLENLRHGSQYRSFYESGRVTVGTIDLTLPPGQYFLVFENLYSVLSNKIVWADVNLEF